MIKYFFQNKAARDWQKFKMEMDTADDNLRKDWNHLMDNEDKEIKLSRPPFVIPKRAV